jgi:hypothetical protein
MTTNVEGKEPKFLKKGKQAMTHINLCQLNDTWLIKNK